MVAFGNPGALATHVKIKHSKLDPEGTGSMLQFVKPKPNVPFWKILAVVGGCWIAKHFLPGKMDPSRMTFVRKWPDNKEQETEKVDGRKNNRGMDGRRSYSNEFKAKVLDEYFDKKACNPSIKQETFASLKGISQGDLSKWLKKSDTIFKAAADATTRRLYRTSGKNISVAKIKFPQMEAELHIEFKERRSHGRRCSANWFKTKAKQIVKDLYENATFTASHGWFSCFLKRFNLCPRKRSNTKQGSVWDRLPFIKNFHTKFRLFLSLGNCAKDRKWGRFLPSCRFNGDQVPLPFVCAATETYEEKGAKRVWIAQMEEGMTKRFCTLHLVFRAEGNQPKPTIIFRGQGLRLTRLEKESWIQGLM